MNIIADNILIHSWVIALLGVVLMSQEQFHDLLDKLSLDEVHKYFAIIVECEKNGKRFKKKSHYQAILDMAAKDRKIIK